MSADAGSFESQSDAALLRMKRAHERGTGCHLTAEMLQALSVTLVGEWWSELKMAQAERAIVPPQPGRNA